MSEWPTVSILIFYLYLLIRQEYVKRKYAFRIGLFGVFIVLFARLVTVLVAVEQLNIRELVDIAKAVETGAVLLAFLAAVAACSKPTFHRKSEQVSDDNESQDT